MDPNLKRKWVKALRSGQYEQTVLVLRSTDDAFCCLGVLCDIQGAEWTQTSGSKAPIFKGVHARAQDTQYVLPRFAGGLSRRTQEKLAEMNDQHVPFAKIADYVEQHL